MKSLSLVDGFDTVPDSGRYPRVLVVDGAPFCRHANTGIVKSNLFQGWHQDALAQIMCSHLRPDFDVCEQFWTLGTTSTLLGALGFAPDRALPSPAAEWAGTIYDPQRAHTFEPRRLSQWLTGELRKSIRVPIAFRVVVGETILRLPSVISAPLSEWIERFAPEVVFTMGGNSAILRLAAKVAERWRIPLVPYFTDDWVGCIYGGELFGGLLRASFLRWFRRSLALSTIRLTASDAMAREYTERYGGRFETFMNPIDRFETTDEPASPTARLSFIGALAPGRWRPLLSIGMALERLKSRGVAGELMIYTFPEDIRQFGQRLGDCKAIHIAGTVEAHELSRIQLESNILVHAESFDESTRLYTHLALSTKIPQYLMAGRCVLAYGPAELASVRYIAETGSGLAVSTENIDELASELEKLISSPALRRTYGTQARRTAIDRHDAVTERERFRSCIGASVGNGPRLYDRNAATDETAR